MPPSPPKAKKDDGSAAVADIAAIATPTILKGRFVFAQCKECYGNNRLLLEFDSCPHWNNNGTEGEYIEFRDPGTDPSTPSIRQRHGTGTYKGNGERYEGDWSHDQIDGRGSFVFANGAAYKGQFRAGRYEGVGRLIWPDKSTYDGDWVDGRMHGRGVYTDASGQTWAGVFRNDCFENDNGTWTPPQSTMTTKMMTMTTTTTAVPDASPGP